MDKELDKEKNKEEKEDYQYVRDDHWLMGDCEDEDLWLFQYVKIYGMLLFSGIPYLKWRGSLAESLTCRI